MQSLDAVSKITPAIKFGSLFFGKCSGVFPADDWLVPSIPLSKALFEMGRARAAEIIFGPRSHYRRGCGSLCKTNSFILLPESGIDR
jgi:hypothetical protein